jgi:hypothetical protein
VQKKAKARDPIPRTDNIACRRPDIQSTKPNKEDLDQLWEKFTRQRDERTREALVLQ